MTTIILFIDMEKNILGIKKKINKENKKEKYTTLGSLQQKHANTG